MKTTVPKLHSIKYKKGVKDPKVSIHVNTYDDISVLIEALNCAIDDHALNMSLSTIVGALEFVKRDILN